MNKKYKVENAVIMAAGLSSRFAPLSYECPKALLKVKNEILIERQIRQLKDAGIEDITVVVGYKKELFYYLTTKFNVKIIENTDYNIRNNNSSLYCARHLLGNTYICSADHYFSENVFELYVDNSYYSAVYIDGKTNEWCIKTNETGLITDVHIGGENSWVMFGHVCFTNELSKKFVAILETVYDLPHIVPLLWESIYIKYIHELPLYIRKYKNELIYEFDTLDELREFDHAYYEYTGSYILNKISEILHGKVSDIKEIKPIKKGEEIIGFEFFYIEKTYIYHYKTEKITEKVEV